MGESIETSARRPFPEEKDGRNERHQPFYKGGYASSQMHQGGWNNKNGMKRKRV